MVVLGWENLGLFRNGDLCEWSLHDSVRRVVGCAGRIVIAMDLIMEIRTLSRTAQVTGVSSRWISVSLAVTYLQCEAYLRNPQITTRLNNRYIYSIDDGTMLHQTLFQKKMIYRIRIVQLFGSEYHITTVTSPRLNRATSNMPRRQFSHRSYASRLDDDGNP
jgi:hypothetical protein